MYTLSSPSVLATDAAAHPGAVQVLRAISSAFRITQDGAFALARAWQERDDTAADVAWGLVAILDLNAPTMPSTLRAAATALRDGTEPSADHLASGRFGTATEVGTLIAAEAAVWPDAPSVPIPGALQVPASAAAAAASVAALWACPELEQEHVRALRAPFTAVALNGENVFETGASLYGPRGESVRELIGQVRAGAITPQQLSSVVWPSGVWSGAMHEAAWTCLKEGRLRAQMRAVIDVTLEFVLANPRLTAVGTRACLPTLHAMTVRRLVADTAGEKALGELALADLAF
ncbi:hypothetical protein KIH74_07410 [Kineosporia sp. J2-2]|uniref:Uncharacterized protein n=1 Tax=Kineosporia corallincola TaxID=2835133 RepID=A0ABS5TF84_9ACTN|nr:hypothetical protein [Kineosporia corallincola]MBT0768748.1 hypothetical protein [Kineosporia corallincola]